VTNLRSGVIGTSVLDLVFRLDKLNQQQDSFETLSNGLSFKQYRKLSLCIVLSETLFYTAFRLPLLDVVQNEGGELFIIFL
jgi:hypothetical protein